MKQRSDKLSEAERLERNRAAHRKYDAASKDKKKRYYQINKKERAAYDKLYRDLNRDAYLLKQKLYNDTKRNKD